MTMYDMTINELEEMLARPEYKTTNYPNHDHPYFERLNDYGNISTLMDDLVEDLGRFPTQTEYIQAGIYRAQKFFTPEEGKNSVTKSWGRYGMYDAEFYWTDPELQKAIVKRLSRSYPSFVVEYTTIIQLKQLYPNFKIGTNSWLDLTAGIDIAIASPNHNRIVYIHVISNTTNSKRLLDNKKTRKGMAMDKNNKKHWYTRNFNKGHIYLAYDRFTDTPTTRFVNGNPILRPEHLKQVIDTAMSFPDPNQAYFDTWYLSNSTEPNQIVHLHKFLMDSNIDTAGMSQLWV